ncbi:MAG: tRNA epoxyqueuosine(34) reductase QueG [Rikenellaceae bacterium]
MLSCKYIKESAIAAGFDLVGVTFPQEFTQNQRALEAWIESGAADSLDYMQRYMDVRFNPANLLEGTRTVVVCAINYKNEFSASQRSSPNPKIASYALVEDYHKVIRKQLKTLLKTLQRDVPHLRGRCCVDTAPLLEKQLAVEAGLGWIGRQSLLITPQLGSFVLLGVLLLDCDVDSLDAPLQGVGCGECRRCVQNCPNGAILPNRTIDSRLCISALTVECDSCGDKELHGWLFGCDECQSCCPYNRQTPLSANERIKPIFSPIPIKEWRSMSPEEFTKRLGSTPLKRGGLARLQRNCRE